MRPTSLTRTLLVLAAAALPFGATIAQPAASRPAEDVARDTLRKPAEMLAFAQVKPGQTVVEIIPGGGYFTRLFSDAVGPRGKVIALVPVAQAARNPKSVETAKALAAEPGRSNITVEVREWGALGAAGQADLVWTSQNYHDIHNPGAPVDTMAIFNRAVFAALKPGGLFVVADHAAQAGSGARDVATLHRIDPAIVKAEVTAAGFRFDGESKALVNSADDHSKNVRNEALRGNTDQFVYRFRKPG